MRCSFSCSSCMPLPNYGFVLSRLTVHAITPIQGFAPETAPQRVNAFAPMLAAWLPVRGRTTAQVLPVGMPLPHAVARLLRRHQIAQSGAVGGAARWVHHMVHLNTSECAHWWVTRRHRPALGRGRRPRGVRHRRESTRRPCHNMVDAVRATDHFNSQVGNHLSRFGTRDATMPRPAIKRDKCQVWTPLPSRRHSQGEVQALISISYEFGLSIVHRSVLIGGMYDRPLRRVADAHSPSCWH
jgi:hypothetical protein